MKNQVFTILIVICQLNILSAQKWDANTTWIYETDEFGPTIDGNYLILKVETDTIINGEEYQEIVAYNRNIETGDLIKDANSSTFLQNSGQKIYYFDKTDYSKHLLYDFTLSTGETYLAYCDIEQSYFTVNIDSISSIELNGVIRGIQYVSSENIDGCYYEGEIIEGIGFLEFLLPRYTYVDPPPGGYLICFDDNTFSYPENGGCDLILSSSQIVKGSVKVYPNPTEGNIFITGKSSNSWKIINIFGKVVKFGETKNSSLSIHELPTGIYYLLLEDAIVQKVIKK